MTEQQDSLPKGQLDSSSSELHEYRLSASEGASDSSGSNSRVQPKRGRSLVDGEVLMNQLQGVLADYLKQNPRRSLNGLSKKCSVSEPTLRRILKGQVKTLPHVTTVMDVLSTVTGEKSPRKIAERFPGPIALYLQEMSPHLEDSDADYDPSLNLELKNPTTYLIYKLASNRIGVTAEKVTRIFGAQGLRYLEGLQEKGYLEKKNEHYFATAQNFSSSAGDFVTNFKSVSDFIKTRDFNGKTNLNPLLANYSEAISEEAYREIVNLQKATLKKIRMILTDENCAGPIPVFLLFALDTLDARTASEISDELASMN